MVQEETKRTSDNDNSLNLKPISPYGETSTLCETALCGGCDPPYEILCILERTTI